ncbi:hypothetical protein PCASD_18799 [Puccinia coronata f. sp. avenae]|uniref:Uncharacterized protein n=1 Tax=Puccinia coronata f. sp. avenae TaxID=200324 RepID=A0A2N5T9L6_9BASI|nr:hypothetical protein PCASD_18799 [Puccinia coronata f. sp. avenae]
METSIPPKPPNSLVITSASSNKQLVDNHHFLGAQLNEGSNQSSVPDSVSDHHFSDQESSNSEDRSIFHPAPEGKTSPHRDPLRICLCLNQSHARLGSPCKAPREASHPLDVCKAGDCPRASDPPPSKMRGPEMPAKSRVNNPKPGPADIPTIKRGCGQPRKNPNPEKDFQPAPLTDAEWDRIEACAVANWTALWNAQEEAELKEKQKQAADLAELKEKQKRETDFADEMTKGKKPLAPSNGTIDSKKKKATIPAVGVRRSARGAV